MAPKAVTHDPQYLDEHHQRISEFADEYFEDEEEREAFRDTLMERRGYARTSGWTLPPPDSSGQPGAAGAGNPPARPRSPYFKK
jgi:hypothetical protein